MEAVRKRGKIETGSQASCSPGHHRPQASYRSSFGVGAARECANFGPLLMSILFRSLLTCFVLAATLPSLATHNEAGEILVCHLGGLEYEVTIVTHTNPNSQADRPEFVIEWGDGELDTVPRLSDTILTFGSVQVKRNLYVATHTYAAAGVYTLQYIDPNRVAGIMNIEGSVDIPMCVQSQIIVTAALNDCLPRFLNAPIQLACIYQPWIHNPAAYDEDGDSLSYEPVICLGPDGDDPNSLGDPISNYLYPDQYMPGPGNQYSMDPVTGTITWDSPPMQGWYNIAFIVREWRDGAMIGWVERDMLIIVVSPCANEPPELGEMIDTCVVAGTPLTFPVSATDPDFGQVITLQAFGGPLVVDQSPAVFTTNPGTSPVSGTFAWNTQCAHVRQQPWQVTFSVYDNYNPSLYDFGAAYVTVVAPAPLNPSATPDGSIMHLAWDPDACSNAIGYRIYRRQQLYGFSPDHCETGVPGYTGYTLISTTTGWGSTTYDDHDLSFGVTYCYMVTAIFADLAESYASVEFCNMLERDVPILTHVSVGATDVIAGIDTVRWSNAWDLDTVQHPGPYHFKLFVGDGFTSASTLLYTSGPSPFLQHPDTSYLHTGINTVNGAHAYRVELYGANDTFIGSGNTASSVFLVPEPNDEAVTLHAQHSTPWINTLYEYYRETSPDVFTLVGTGTTGTYVDTGLVNGQEYCWYVRTTGAYSDPSIVAPLLNFSQIVCASPVDLTPPCPPTVSLDNDCETPRNSLTWNNPNESCADDTYQYHIWFTPSFDEPLQVIATLIGAENTFYQHTDGQSVAGCYAVSAIDTVGNESLLSDTVCGDNCPTYELPNVFSPNSDGTNDLFVPFPYRGVKEIDLHIYNRWGQLVFTSTDPDIEWPGTYKNAGEPVPDGVYYYTCDVMLRRLAGDEPLRLKGYVHVLRGNQARIN